MFLFSRAPEKSADNNSRGWPLGGCCLYYTIFFISSRDATLLLRKLEVFCGQSVGPRRPWGQGFSSYSQEIDPAISCNPPNELQFYSNRRAVLLTKTEALLVVFGCVTELHATAVSNLMSHIIYYQVCSCFCNLCEQLYSDRNVASNFSCTDYNKCRVMNKFYADAVNVSSFILYALIYCYRLVLLLSIWPSTIVISKCSCTFTVVG